MRMYHDIKEMLCRELEEITAKGELTAGTLDTVDKLTHAIKSIETIMAMEDGGYSREGGASYRGGGSSRGRSYDNGGGGGGASGARGRGRYARRDSMGRYAASYDGYSFDEAKDEMLSELRELMEDAPNEEIKKEYKRFIAKIDEKM